MKYVTIILFSALAMPAFATSLITGPYLNKAVGVPEADAKWASCLIRPGSVIVNKSVDGVETPAPAATNSLNAEELQNLIEAAKKEPLHHALHIMRAVPTVRIVAGVFPELQSFDLFHDASALDYRDGANSEKLLKLVDELCGDLSLPN